MGQGFWAGHQPSLSHRGAEGARVAETNEGTFEEEGRGPDLPTGVDVVVQEAGELGRGWRGTGCWRVG